MAVLSYLYLLTLINAASVESVQFKNILHKEKFEGKPLQQSEDNRYCFHFTWLQVDNQTFDPGQGQTCAERFANSKSKPLCVDPLVVTPDASTPDIDWMYFNLFGNVTSRLNNGSVCVKFTQTFNGVPEYVTRYSTKVTLNDLAMTSGCVRSYNGPHQTEVCVCSSAIGDKPCNHANFSASAHVIYLLSFIIILYTLRSI